MAGIAILAEVEMGQGNMNEEIDSSKMVPGRLSRSGSSLHGRSRKMVVDLAQALTLQMQCNARMDSTAGKMHTRNIAGAVCKEVCNTLKICKGTYYRILKENEEAKASGKKLHTPGKIRLRSSVTTSVDSFDKYAIRRKIYQLYAEGKFPYSAILYKYASEELKFTGAKSSFHTFMKTELGFQYECVNRRKIFMEMHDVCLARHRFLRAYKECTESQRNIVFLDTTSVWQNHFGSVPKSDNCSGRKGMRLVLLHAGGDAGFVKDCLLHFVSKSGNVCDHRDMDAKVFTNWFQKNLLMNIPPNSVIVMDNTSYNSDCVDKCPTTVSTKAEMLAWLQKKDIKGVTSEMLKVELYELVKQHAPSAVRYVVDEMASNAGHQVLRLPPYHRHYNPIELIWAEIKKTVAVKNTTLEMKDIEQHAINAVNSVTALDWQGCIKRTDDLCKADMISEGEIEGHVDQLLMRLSGDNESDMTSDSEEDDS